MEKQKLKRVLNTWDVAGLTIGVMMGAGIFTVSGLALKAAGPSVILSVIISAVVGFLTALTYAELASAHPQAGGAYLFSRLAFRGRWGIIPFIVGSLVILELTVGGALITNSWAEYMAQVVPLPSALLKFVPPVLILLIILQGTKVSSGINLAIVGLKILILAVLAISAFFHASADAFVPFSPGGIGGTLYGAAIFFFAFVGFEVAAGVAGDAENPAKTMTKGILLGFAVVTAVYVAVMLALVFTLGGQGSTSGSPIADAAMVTLGAKGAQVLSVIAVFALLSTLLSGMIGATRLVYAMARDKVLPVRLAALSKRGVPVPALIFIVAVQVVMIQFYGISSLANVLNFGTLAAFLFVNMALIILRRREDYQPASFQAPLFPVLPIVGMLSSMILILVLDRLTLKIGLLYILASVIYYFIVRKKGESADDTASSTTS